MSGGQQQSNYVESLQEADAYEDVVRQRKGQQQSNHVESLQEADVCEDAVRQRKFNVATQKHQRESVFSGPTIHNQIHNQSHRGASYAL